ncbi:MAG: response regulator, partial [Chloroflexi bacterium]|nr:response regulator [Chloroflexota bacterium]
MAPKLVIVEDDLPLQRALRLAFEKAGYSVVCAGSGPEALQQIEKETPDLVILDVMLPGMSGLDVCRQLWQKPASATLPILMLSAMSQVSNKVTGLDAGADDYVTKPFDPTELSARVRALLERGRRLRDSVPGKRARMLGFVGARGGVGTTTVAVNVAVALAQHKASVILFEPQPYFGAVASCLGLKPRWSWADVVSLPEPANARVELTRYLTPHSRYLQVLPAPQTVQPQQTFSTEACGALTANQGEMLVAGLAEMADYLVLDIPRSSLEAVRQALPRCDCPVVVLEPDLASV